MSNQSQKNTVNFEKLSDFLNAFFPDPSETIRLRAFAAKSRDTVVSARSFGVSEDQLTTLSDLQEKLILANEERGLYFVVNSGGDTDAEIDRYNAFFAENDDLPLDEQHARLDSCPLVPSVRVETLKSVHAYWLINGSCSESEWRDIQQRLIDYFKGDEKIKNPARVMRLPYFRHVSYDPESENYSFKPVTVVKFDKDLRYTVGQMQEAFPPAVECDANDHTANTSTPPLTTWDELNAETRRRIRRLTPTPKLSGDGDWLHAKGICHNGTGNTALYINLETGAYGCQKGCDAVVIRRALRLPEQPQSRNGEEQSISSWRDFSAKAFEIREKIVAELEIGEVGVVFASTDVGKTTLALNLSLTLAAAGTFEPLVEPKEGGRRVLYIDGESREARLQADIRLMLRDWDDGENSLVDQNLYLACDTSLEGEQLDLTKRKHWKWLEDEAARVKPALIVLDTMVSLFSVNNENDNSEVSRKVMRPLAKLASDTGAAILLLHHIGKLSEDAQAGTKAYRGRGASAIGAAARMVLLLKQDSNNPDLVSLSCAKVKGKKFPDVLLKLHRDARWFVNTHQAPATEPTSYQRVIEVVSGFERPVKRSEIEVALKGVISIAQIGKHLNSALEGKDLIQPKYGYYAAPEHAQSLDAIDDEQVSNFKNGAPPFQDLHVEDAHSVVA
jgi:hypothetical protein